MKRMTEPWRNNAISCLRTCGLMASDGKDLSTLPTDIQDDLARMWGYYVDRGMDFGSAALKVMKDLNK